MVMDARLIFLGKVLDLVLLVASKFPEEREEMETLADELRAMIAEGREPTEGQWATVARSIGAKTARLREIAGLTPAAEGST